MKMGTRGPQFRGSPFSYDTGRNARRFRRSLENASLWPLGLGSDLVCAHGTTIVTNRESSELVGERIFYALQVRTRTI